MFLMLSIPSVLLYVRSIVSMECHIYLAICQVMLCDQKAYLSTEICLSRESMPTNKTQNPRLEHDSILTRTSCRTVEHKSL
jgi:hypothetical protein